MIQRIYIKNYKGFVKRTIDVSEHNIIIGENDAGKSTILEAVNGNIRM